MPFPLAYSGPFSIRTYEIDHHKRATVASLVKLMHEAAMQNVLKLKLSVWDLEPLQISWVLRRKILDIHALPNLGDQIKVVTCPAGFERFFTYRDYYIYNEQDQLLASSSSTWLLMDTAQRKMAPIPSSILLYGDEMLAPDAYLPRPSGKLQKLETPHKSLSFRVDWHDLDFNGHLNNTYYVQWMLEALGPEVLNNQTLKKLDIIYKAECYQGASLIAEVQVLDDLHFVHQLRMESDNSILAVAETWFT